MVTVACILKVDDFCYHTSGLQHCAGDAQIHILSNLLNLCITIAYPFMRVVMIVPELQALDMRNAKVKEVLF